MSSMRPYRLFVSLISALILASCGSEPAKFADVDSQRLLNAAATPEEWLTYGGTYDEQRHSTLTGITKENISELAPAWTYDLKTIPLGVGGEARPDPAADPPGAPPPHPPPPTPPPAPTT